MFYYHVVTILIIVVVVVVVVFVSIWWIELLSVEDEMCEVDNVQASHNYRANEEEFQC